MVFSKIKNGQLLEVPKLETISLCAFFIKDVSRQRIN